MADLGHVHVAALHQHSVKRVDGARAGMALHQAARDEPAWVCEGKSNTAMTLLHGGPAAVRAAHMLTVECFCFFVLSG